MTEQRTNETDDGIAFKRRDVLRTVGGIGALSAIGTETATAKQPKRFYVGTKPGKAHVAKRRASEVNNVIDLKEIGTTVVGRWPEEALRGLRNNPHIRYVEEEQFDVPHYDLPDEILPWGVDRVDAEVAHGEGDTGSGVHVAISDTGIDADHPDLAGNLGDGYATSGNTCADGSHPDGNCDEDWDDTDGHGTHVAGTVAAIANTEGVVGVAPDVTLHAVKIFPGGTHAQIEEGLKWAADHPDISVVNMSHGGSDSQTKRDGIEYAANAGLLLVSSAGNDGNKSNCDDDDCIGYPAAYDEVIAVSNVTDDDTLSSSSSVGPEMDIAAPGDQIPSTWFDGEYNTISGTSMASPHVAGAGALLIEDGEDAAGARTILESTAVDIGLASFEQGNGLLDVAAALGHNSANDLLEVETDLASGVGLTDATLHGELTQLTGSASADVFFEWGPGGGPPFPNTTSAGSKSSPDTFSESISGLTDDTNYQFRAGATNAEGSTEYGGIQTFDTEFNDAPEASFSVVPSNPNVGQTVTFTSTSTDEDNAIVSYDWDFDDGDTDSGPVVTHMYTSHGTVTATLTVEDELGKTDIAYATFYVNAPPEAAFTFSPGDPIVTESVDFDGSTSFDVEDDSADLGYDWDLDGDGLLGDATGQMVSYAYPTSGPRTVKLQVTDSNGATDEVTAAVTVVTVEEAIDQLIADVESLGLQRGVENSLTIKLKNAKRSLSKGDDEEAREKIMAFINEVEAQRGKKLTDAEVDALVELATRILDVI